MSSALEYRLVSPPPALAWLVESYWLLRSTAPTDKPVLVLPDGRVDVQFAYTTTEPFGAMLMGLGTGADHTTLEAGTHVCAVSLRLPAVEYLLHTHVADALNGVRRLPEGFWGLTQPDLTDFDQFCAHLNALLPSLLPAEIDGRKRRLFEQLYATDGALSVQEMADHAGWSPRQINRYFRAFFGLSLKEYCGILRFRAAFPQLKAGRLFPEQHFADQAHFIREVRRLAGVRPKELARNQNDRFIQFSAWPPI